MKNLLLISLLLTFFQVEAQKDTSNTVKLNRQKTDFSFEKKIFLVSPSFGIVKNTKNNFGIDVEYALTSVLGIVAGVGTSSLKDDVQSYFFKIPAGKPFFGPSLGLRLHTGYNNSKVFDFVPGIYWSRVFSEYLSGKGFKSTNSPNLISAGVNLRLFVNKHVGFDFGISKGLSRKTDAGFSIGLSIK